MEKKIGTNRFHAKDNGEKHYRYSIRKFNVGVASVAISAFFLFGGRAAVAADSISDTTSSGQVVVVEEPSGDTASETQISSSSTSDNVATTNDEIDEQILENDELESQENAGTDQSTAAIELESSSTDSVTSEAPENVENDQSDTGEIDSSGSASPVRFSLMAVNPTNTAQDGDAARKFETVGDTQVDYPYNDPSSYDYSGYTVTQPTSHPLIAATGLEPEVEGTTYVRLFRIREAVANSGSDRYTSEQAVLGYLMYHVDTSDATYYITRFDASGNVVEEITIGHGETRTMVDEENDMTFLFDRTNVDERIVRVDVIKTSNPGSYLQSLEQIVPTGSDSGIFGDTENGNGMANAAITVTVPVITSQPTYYIYAPTGTEVTAEHLQYLMSTATYTATAINVDENYRLVAVTQYDSTTGEMVVHTLPGYGNKYEYQGATIVSDGDLEDYIDASGTVTAWGGNGYHRASEVGLFVRHVEIVDQLTGQANIWFTDDRDGDYSTETVEESKARAILFGISSLGLDTDGDGEYDSYFIPTIDTTFNTASYDEATGIFTAYKTSYAEQELGLGTQYVSVILARKNPSGNDERRIFTYAYNYSFYAPEVYYYYEPVVGNVVVNYYSVDANGNVIEAIAAERVDTIDSFEGTTYDTTDADNPDGTTTKPSLITYNGKTYQLVSVAGTNPHAETDGSAESGEIVVDQTLIVNYYYEEVIQTTTEEEVYGNVVVHYVDKDGEELATDHVDTTNELVATITTTTTTTISGGKAYDEDGNEIGDVVETNYTGTKYNTLEEGEQPATLEKDGVTYYLLEATDEMTDGTEVIDGVKQEESQTGEGDDTVKYTADTNTEVIQGTTHVTYVYQPGGDVVVRYFAVDSEGNVIEAISGTAQGIDQETVATEERDTEEGTKPSTDYDTTDLKPTYITTEDGKTYKRVDLNGTNPHAYTDGVLAEDDPASYESGSETGDTVKSEATKVVNYYYELVTGNVEVHYHIVDQDGNVIVTDAIDSRTVKEDADIDEDYSTVLERDAYITVDGKTYRLVTEESNPHPYTDGDEEEGTVTEGTKVIHYYYEEVPAEEVVTGNVYVYYYSVDKDGNVVEQIAADVTDTEDGDIDSAYDTTD
ncbi:YSIRK-type signal peptide-containing protein, partial [Streptococcus gallolyticus]